ncbi:MAG: hypothetical protein IPJ98_15520 [Bryobacterales bacterium]|nr:hypothetical protein [Bryobacterales bacterium]
MSYGIAFILLVLSVGLVFRSTLRSIMYTNTAEILEQEWSAVRGYLQIDGNRTVWFFDRNNR